MRQRVRFSKLGKVRFLSHRDLARVWERTLRRAEVRVAYSEGFSPRPRLSFGLALSTGHESLGEYLDIDLAADAGVEPEDLPARVAPHLPTGLVAHAAAWIPPGTDSLQHAVTSCTWRIEVPTAAPAELAARVAAVLAVDALPTVVDRKGSPVELDARPAILALEVADGGHPGPWSAPAGPVLVADLATQPRSLRPAELVRALDPSWSEGRVLRTHQWTLVDGARAEPLPTPGASAGATSTAHAEARAS